MQDVIFEDSPVSFNKRIFIMYFTIRAVSVDNVPKDDDRMFSLKIRRLEFPVFVFTIYLDCLDRRPSFFQNSFLWSPFRSNEFCISFACHLSDANDVVESRTILPKAI